MKLCRIVSIIVVTLSLVLGSAAIDINSSGALQYYNDGSLEFEVNESGFVQLENDTFLNGNRIRGLDDPKAPQDAVTRAWVNDNAAGSLNETLAKGNTTGGYDLNVENSNITSTTGNVTVGKGLKVYGDLWLAGSGDSESVKSPFQNLTQVMERGNSVGAYDLDMNGQTILDIGGLQNCGADEFVNGNGNCETDTQIADTDDQDLSEVLAQGNSVGAYSINLNGNAINTGGGTVTINDSMNDQDIARFKEGGNVEIPNGNLSLGGNSLTSVGGLQNCGPNEFLNGNGNCETDTDTDQDNQDLTEVLAQGNKTGGRDIDLDGGEIVDSTGTTTLGGGNVEVSDGDLKIADGNGLVVGGTAKQQLSNTWDSQILGTTTADTGLAIARWSNDGAAPTLHFAKSRGTSIGATGALSSGDIAGQMTWKADDGNDRDSRIAMIRAVVDGSVSADDTPGRFEFYTTPDGARRGTKAMEIDSSQNVEIPNGNLDVKSPSNTGNTVDVGGSLQTDGDLKTHSGNVGSSTRMCIGDRCA